MSAELFFGVVVLLIGFSVFREVLHSNDREKLLDRLAAKDLREYKWLTEKKEKPQIIPALAKTDEELYHEEQAALKVLNRKVGDGSATREEIEAVLAGVLE